MKSHTTPKRGAHWSFELEGRLQVAVEDVLGVVPDAGVDRQGRNDSPLVLEENAVALGRRLEGRLVENREVGRGAVREQVVLVEDLVCVAGGVRVEGRLGEVAVARAAVLQAGTDAKALRP